MDGKMMTAFTIWAIVGCVLIGIGISAFFSKKAVGFWANAKALSISCSWNVRRIPEIEVPS